MIAGLDPIPIQELRISSCPKVWLVDGYLDDLQSLTPIRGEVTAEHQGDMLSVKGDIETVVNLSCDRCLNSFNQQLGFTEQELIWIRETYPNPNPKGITSFKELRFTLPDSMVEIIDPSKEFDPERWIFEHLNLRLEPINLCGSNCPGPTNLSSPKANQNIKHTSHSSENFDPRWSTLKKLIA